MNVEGRNAVFEVLSSDKTVDKVLVQNGLRDEQSRRLVQAIKEAGVKFSFTDKSVLDKMRELSDYTFIATEKDSVYQLFGYDNALGDISDGISIPDEYTYNDCNTRMELLRGLMDSSGWISGLMHISALNYMAPNEVIGRQFEELIYGLGWSFKKTGLLTYQLHVPNADKMKFFSIHIER